MTPQSPVVCCTVTKTRRHKSEHKTNNRICRFRCVLEVQPPPGIGVTQRVNGQNLSDPAACVPHLRSARVEKKTSGPKGWTASGIPLRVRHICYQPSLGCFQLETVKCLRPHSGDGDRGARVLSPSLLHLTGSAVHRHVAVFPRNVSAGCRCTEQR